MVAVLPDEGAEPDRQVPKASPALIPQAPSGTACGANPDLLNRNGVGAHFGRFMRLLVLRLHRLPVPPVSGPAAAGVDEHEDRNRQLKKTENRNGQA
jgi:hypothetical protein